MVEPHLPRSDQARSVWRSLSPGDREAAFAAARSGVAPDDVAIAWAAAGYGRIVARRLRIMWMLTPLFFAVVAIPVAVALAASGAPERTFDGVLAFLVIGVLGGLVALSLVARRYQRLYSSGLAGIEAARLSASGLTTGYPAAGRPASTAAESEFTVPYYAQMPVVAPAPPVRTDPVAAGVYEIPARRTRAVISFAALLLLGLVLWLVVVDFWSTPRETPILASVITAVTLLYTFAVTLLLYAAAPALRQPVSARFTPDGWELPALRMRGSWADVRAIRVRPVAARGSTAGTPQLAEFRVVTLIVDDPQQPIAHLSALRRRLLQSTIKKYGSPVAIVATPRRTIPVVELVRLLQSYTAAPLDWA